MSSENERVAKKWSQRKPSPEDCNFNMSPVFSRHKIECAFGKEFVDEFGADPHFAEDIFVRKYLKGRAIRTVLSLCCGFGRIERRIVRQLATVERCIGIDVAPGALAEAAQAAAEEKLDCISYVCADLNNSDWAEDKYDLVIAYGALHHLENLDMVLDGVYRCLNPGGLLFSHEYIGLPYYDCSPRQLQLINAVAYLVPPELRMRQGIPFARPQWLFRLLSHMNSVSSGYFDNNWPVWKKVLVKTAGKIFRASAKDGFGYLTLSPRDIVCKADSSEGVSAPRIISGLQQRFASLDIMHSGGSLLEHALDNQFYAAFDNCNPLHRRTADLLWSIERFFTEAGEVAPHNVYLVAEKK